MVQPHNRIGIVLAGGKGTRLYPLTKVVSKQLLPVYNKPVIYYPIETLIQTGHQQIIIITKPEDKELFKELILSNEEWNCEFIFLVQEEPKGLPDAFNVAHDYIVDRYTTLILGDNIFDINYIDLDLSEKKGSRIFIKKHKNAKEFGVVEINKNKKIISLEEKPNLPKSQNIIVGLYLFDETISKKVENIKPSNRNELEIFDILNLYLKETNLQYSFLPKSCTWFDIGSIEGLYLCNQYFRKKCLKI